MCVSLSEGKSCQVAVRVSVKQCVCMCVNVTAMIVHNYVPEMSPFPKYTCLFLIFSLKK